MCRCLCREHECEPPGPVWLQFEQAFDRAHCVANPGKFAGYGESCWGLTASYDPWGYSAHAPDTDNGTITPTGALASLPYAPAEVVTVLRHFLKRYGKRLWGEFGFVNAFCESQNWYADRFLAIDQGPIIVMNTKRRPITHC